MTIDPVEVNVSDGLAKFFEYADLISEQKVKELAEKSRNEAMKYKKESKSRGVKFRDH